MQDLLFQVSFFSGLQIILCLKFLFVHDVESVPFWVCFVECVVFWGNSSSCDPPPLPFCGSRADVNASDSDGRTPLLTAVSCGRNVIDTLTNGGASLEEVDGENSTVAHLAVENNAILNVSLNEKVVLSITHNSSVTLTKVCWILG